MERKNFKSFGLHSEATITLWRFEIEIPFVFLIFLFLFFFFVFLLIHDVTFDLILVFLVEHIK